MSHVRSASRGFEVCDENSHPFKLGHLILTHNGTLEPDNDKDKIDKTIDSFWFLTKLSDIIKNRKLAAEDIAKAMESFTGKFAFIIHDIMQPNLIYIVKGKADLHYCRILNEKQEQVLFVINTVKRNIETMVATIFYRIFTGENLKIVDLKSFDDESIYIYDVTTSELAKTNVKIPERFTPVTEVYTQSWRGGYRGTCGPHVYTSLVTNKDRQLLVESAEALHLSFSEINSLFEYTFGNSILFVDDGEIDCFSEVLDTLQKGYDDNKYRYWEKIKDTAKAQRVDLIYDEYKLQFPWFLESNNGLRHVFTRVSKRNSNR
jgi:hypothetical protein